MPAPKLTLVAAIGRNRVIGRDNGMPWRIPSEMAHFKAQTLGKPVLMGRKTWDSLRLRPLPGRANLVLTRDAKFRAEGAFVYTKLDALIAAAAAMAENANAEEICVIGGSLLYAETLPLADRLRLSLVDMAPEGDVLFPVVDFTKWREVHSEYVERTPKDDASFTVRVLDRVR